MIKIFSFKLFIFQSYTPNPKWSKLHFAKQSFHSQLGPNLILTLTPNTWSIRFLLSSCTTNALNLKLIRDQERQQSAPHPQMNSSQTLACLYSLTQYLVPRCGDYKQLNTEEIQKYLSGYRINLTPLPPTMTISQQIHITLLQLIIQYNKLELFRVSILSNKLDNAKRGIPSQGAKVDLEIWPCNPKSIGFFLLSWTIYMWSLKVI